MSERPKTPRQLEVLVLRAERPHHASFRWELREYGKAISLRVGDELHPSQSDARSAGNAALAAFRDEA